jgi:hypothetical protein
MKNECIRAKLRPRDWELSKGVPTVQEVTGQVLGSQKLLVRFWLYYLPSLGYCFLICKTTELANLSEVFSSSDSL